MEVDSHDPAFQNPTKFIGPVYSLEQVAQVRIAHPAWSILEDGPYYRRVIASPKPQKIIEISTIKLLVAARVIVICCGGGGIPVINQNGFYRGVEAVIDKDAAAALLAEQLEADCLLMLTDVKAVMQDWGKPEAKPINQLSLTDLESNFFASGSMGPKVEAGARFVRATGKKAYIGALDEASSILQHKSGTRIIAA